MLANFKEAVNYKKLTENKNVTEPVVLKVSDIYVYFWLGNNINIFLTCNKLSVQISTCMNWHPIFYENSNINGGN